MGRSRFVANPRAERELGAELAVRLALRAKAEQVAAEARRIAMAEAYRTGEYHDSIEADAGADATGRVIGRVNAHDPKSAVIELGSSRQRTIATLRRALDRAAR